MSDLVIVQSRDTNGRTMAVWYADTHEAERDNPLIIVGGGALWIDEEAPRDQARKAIGLYLNELTFDPRADLSWLPVTHERDGDGYVRPVAPMPGGLSEDERNLRDMIRADYERNFGIGQVSDG